MTTIMDEFSSFCAELNLTDEVMKGAQTFLIDTTALLSKASFKIEKKGWFVCGIFVAVQDVYCPYDSSKLSGTAIQPEVTVTQLLEKADMNVMDFFNAMCVLKTNHSLSDSSKQSLIALERKYLIVSALYDKFESMVQEIFCVNIETSSEELPFSAHTMLHHHKSLCWILFLVAKAKVLWHRQELLATFHLLLCCIGEVVKSTPTFLLLPPFDSIVAKSENSMVVLESLSNHVKTKFEEVKAVHNCWLHVASELMSGSNLPELQDLQSSYSKLYLQSGDIDESLFLKRDWHLLPSVEQNNSPRKKIPTLIRRTLDTADALNKILRVSPDDFSESLKQCLQKCSVDATSLIKDFIKLSREKFVKAFVDAQEGSDQSLPERRFKLASRYYYLMLDAMLKKEAERLSISEFTAFIQNKIFHRSLLACCIEVTLMSCGSIGPVNFTPVQQEGNTLAQGILFPWVIKVFELKAFHFFKIIESFIRGAPTITHQIIKHLKQVEDKILDSLAWQSDSPIFGSLSGKGCSQGNDTKVESPKPSQSFWSPNKEGTQKNVPISPRSCHAANIFLNKVSRLAFQRMEAMCSLLSIKKEIQDEIWVCIEHIIYKNPEFLKDRNIDQIIMCCIYAVSKILENEVRFKTIISNYMQLPHASNSVYKQVMTNGKKEFIITFYNNHFFAEMNDYILSQFGNKNKEKSSSTSLRDVQSPFVLSPAYSIPGKKNVFVSPLVESPFKNPNEIIYQRSYIVGSQSPKKLQELNESLKVLQPASKNSEETKGKKRLQFDEADPSQEFNCAKKVLRFYMPPNAKSFVSKSNSGEPSETK